MDNKNITIEEYKQMSLEEKINFYSLITNDNQVFTPAIRQRKTKNIKSLGDKQPNGFLTFIEELRRTDKQVTNFSYLCKCDCGNWYILTNRHFDTENIISCGCYRKKRGVEMCKNLLGPNNCKDITGQIFGDLEVLEKTNKRAKNNSVIWKCRCLNCNKEQEAQGTMLIRGIRIFCEYCSQRKSKGEKIISMLLDINNIPYIKEYHTDNCRFPNSNNYAYFDFFINNQYLIEYDGQQHFQPETFNNISQERANEIFQSNVQRDQYKNNWCKENNIPLIRIPYTHLENLCLKDLLLETSTFLIK